MVLYFKQVEITKRSGTGSQVVTGVGFRPKFIIFKANRQTTSGYATSLDLMLGFATSPSEEAVFSTMSEDGSEQNWELVETDGCIMLLQNSDGEADEKADLTSMDIDGFTLNWSISTTTQWKITAQCYGGSDIDDVHVGTVVLDDSTGNQSFTGFGFQPDLVMSVGDGANMQLGTPKNKGQMQFSVAKSSSERWVNTGAMKSKGMGDATVALFDATQFMSSRKDDTTWDSLSDFVSMDSDGFTINQTTAGMDPADVLVVGLKFAGKGNSHVGFFNTVTTAPTVDQAVTGVGFKPRTLFTVNSNESEGTDNSNCEYSFGMTDATQESARGVFTTAGDGSRDDRYLDNKFIEMSQVNGTSPPTTLKEADLKSMDLDGFTVTWTVNNASAEAVGFFAIGGSERPHWQGQRPQPLF